MWAASPVPRVWEGGGSGLAPRRPPLSPQGRKQWVPSGPRCRTKTWAGRGQVGTPNRRRVPGEPLGKEPQRLFMACARSTGPMSVDPRRAEAVGLSWKATSGHLPELSAWPDGPGDWAGSDTLGRAGAAPRRTTVPWPWSVSRASPSRWSEEAGLMGVSRASAWWESTDRLQGCEEGWRRTRCPKHQGEFRGLPRPGGSQSSCCGGLPASDSGGSGGMAGSGVVASRCPRGPAL